MRLSFEKMLSNDYLLKLFLMNWILSSYCQTSFWKIYKDTYYNLFEHTCDKNLGVI